LNSELIRIAITGPESTGKSQLSRDLAERYNTVWVPEYAREYLEKLGRPYAESDLLKIAEGQMANEKRLEKHAGRFLFCDTELLVIKIWSDVKYGRCDPWILKKLSEQRYHLYLLCNTDTPWEYDPLREHPLMREKLFLLYHREMQLRSWPFRIVTGLGSDRLTNAIKMIESFRNS
jgi:NadR type nicotinamide-nucleotide adenylyltransferase